MSEPVQRELRPELPALLIDQITWLRRLARALVHDPERAEDLVQDTLVLALEHPPGESGAPRGWLRRVLENRHRETLRDAKRRTRRERAGAKPEALEPTDALIARVQLQQRIADQLLALDSPLRDALLMRYVDGLPPRKIAARLRVPLATVKSRLARGLMRLRERMDHEHGGDRSAWAAALLPLAREAMTATTLGLGGLTMGLKATMGAAALVAAAAWLWSDGQGAPRIEEPGADLRALSGPIAQASATEGAPRQAQLDRQRTPAVTAAPSTTTAAVERVTHTVLGRAIDVLGRGVPGAKVRLAGEEQVTETGADGRFRLNSEQRTARIESADERFIAVRTASWTAQGDADAILMLAPAVAISGWVLDPWGRGVRGARVVLEGVGDLPLPAGVSLASTFMGAWSKETDAEGAFDLGSVPRIEGLDVVASQGGYLATRTQLPERSLRDLVIVLRPPTPAPGESLMGRVLRPDGLPASAALVALGKRTTTTDAGGNFVFDLNQSSDPTRLSAVESGYLPVVLERPRTPSGGDTGWPEFVELVLEQASLAISGKVLNADGTPRPDVRIWLAEPEVFSLVGRVPVTIESLAAGGRPPEEAIESLAKIDEAGLFDSARPVYEPNALVYWATTDAAGQFRLGGLQPRDYVLHVVDRALTWGVITDPMPAGTSGVEIVADPSVTYERVRGRVVTAKGDPVPGVGITRWVTATSQSASTSAGNSDVTRFFLGAGVTTDADGRFELTSVPRQHLSFFVYGDGILPSYASSDEIEDPEAFEIEVLARVPFEFEAVPGPEAPNAIRVSDALGAPLAIYELRADGYSNFAKIALVEGRSGVLSLTTNAANLHLLRGDDEITQVPIYPRPGETLTVRW